MAVNGHAPKDHEYWAVYLAAVVGAALTGHLEESRGILRSALQRFTRSSACHADTRQALRQITKGEKNV